MEHPSKRRRIDRRANGSLRALLSFEGRRHTLKTDAVVPLPPPEFVLSSSETIKDDVVPKRPSATLRGRALSVQHLTLRDSTVPLVADGANQLQPVSNAAGTTTQSAQPAADAAKDQYQNAADKTLQPIQQAAQPALGQAPQVANTITNPVQQAAGPVVTPVQEAGNTVAGTAQTQVGQPIINGANNAAQSTKADSGSPASVATDTNENVTNVNGPGTVQPPAAVAAASARQKALEEQEAKAAIQNPNVPGSEGPAPPSNQVLPATSQDGGNVADARFRSSTSQISGSSTHTAVPAVSSSPSQIPTPSMTTSFFSTRQQLSPSSMPTLLPSALPSTSQLASTNSTLTSMPSSTPTLSSSSQPNSLSGSSTLSQAFFGAVSGSISGSSGLQTPSASFSGSFPSLVTSASVSTTTLVPTSSSTFDQSSSASASGVGFAGGNPTSGGSTSTSTPASSASSNGAPPTGALVGGICGGVAGLVLIIAAILFLLRNRKRKYDSRREISPPIPQSAGAGSAALGGGGVMTQRSSIRSSAPIVAAANLIGRLRPGSSQTATTASSIPSEKGFQKLSGKKLPSVLHSGGDGYGEKSAVALGSTSKPPPRSIAPGQSHFAGLAPALRPPSPQRSLSGSSFYRDSHGFYGGVGASDLNYDEKTVSSASPTSSSPTIPVGQSAGTPFAAAGHPPGQSSPGVPNIRPGPARQPIIQQGGIVPMRTPSRPGTAQQRPTTSPIPEHPFPRDPLGRSHPSQDGSRQSRFRESTTPP